MARNPGGDKVSGFFDRAAEAAKQVRAIKDYVGAGAGSGSGGGGSKETTRGGGSKNVGDGDGGNDNMPMRKSNTVGAIDIDDELKMFLKAKKFGAKQLKAAAEELEARSSAQHDAEERERVSKEKLAAEKNKNQNGVGVDDQDDSVGKSGSKQQGADGEGGMEVKPLRSSGRLMSQGAITKIRSISPLMRKTQRMRAIDNLDR